MTAAPYPTDTRSKGWRFELDLERVKQSDTWALAPPELRPWLYMLWCESWLQTPCGSLPADDALLAARIGMQVKAFHKAKAVLLRGWWEADDGRLYHDTIVTLVQSMLTHKDAERQRKAEYRARMDAERAALATDVPRDRHGTDTGRTVESSGRDDTGTSTGTGTVLREIPSVPKGTGVPPTDKDVIFANGVPLLTAAGVKESNARSFLALQCKTHGEPALRRALEDCAREGAIEPVSWLTKVLGPAKPGGKADALMARNIATAARFLEGQPQ